MDSDIYAALLLAKIAAIFVFLLCKIFGLKIWSCKFFDKSQVCCNHLERPPSPIRDYVICARPLMVGQVDTTHPKIVRSRSTSRLKRFNGSQEMMNTMITEASRYMALALGLAYICKF